MARCQSYLVHHFSEHKGPPIAGQHIESGPSITISAQTGSGAHEVGRRLASILQADEPYGAAPWTVFDRQLVEKVLEEHHLPAKFAKYMSEDRRSYLDDVLDELAGLRPPSWVLVPKITQTILHLAEAGHVILISRGASFVTARMPHVFHVRLVASLSRRTERVQQAENLSAGDAAKFIAKTDRGRVRYVKAHFHTRIDDGLQYHIILNTDKVPLPEAAELIANGARRCFKGDLETQPM